MKCVGEVNFKQFNGDLKKGILLLMDDGFMFGTHGALSEDQTTELFAKVKTRLPNTRNRFMTRFHAAPGFDPALMRVSVGAQGYLHIYNCSNGIAKVLFTANKLNDAEVDAAIDQMTEENARWIRKMVVEHPEAFIRIA